MASTFPIPTARSLIARLKQMNENFLLIAKTELKENSIPISVSKISTPNSTQGENLLQQSTEELSWRGFGSIYPVFEIKSENEQQQQQQTNTNRPISPLIPTTNSNSIGSNPVPKLARKMKR